MAQQAEEEIISRAIIQIVGKPEGNIITAMDLLIQKIKKDDHLKVTSIDVSEVEPKDNLFSILAEIEFKTPTIDQLAWFCFDYLPASIEIIEPRELKYSAQDLTSFFNEIQTRIHAMDLAMKSLTLENKKVKKNGNSLIRNILYHLTKEGPKSLRYLAQETGIKDEDLQSILTLLVEQGRMTKEDDAYQWHGPA